MHTKNLNSEKIEEAARLSDVYDNIMDFKEQLKLGNVELLYLVDKNKELASLAILILDDSVSAVDTKTEEAIIGNLHRVRKGRTTIFIAHRISTVKKMDKIILIDDGKVVAVGSHKELMKSSVLSRYG